MAFIVGFAQLVFLFNMIWSIRHGKEAGGNPWRATSLEWQTAETPPGHGNFGKELPVVYRWAYDYSVPGAKEDFIPQNEPGVYAGLQGHTDERHPGLPAGHRRDRRLVAVAAKADGEAVARAGHHRGVSRHRVRHDAGGEGRARRLPRRGRLPVRAVHQRLFHAHGAVRLAAHAGAAAAVAQHRRAGAEQRRAAMRAGRRAPAAARHGQARRSSPAASRRSPSWSAS